MNCINKLSVETEAYTLNFARPFCRLAVSTRLPDFVAERTRKPWVVALFLLFG